MKTAIQTACNEIIDELIDVIEIGYMTKIIHIMHKHLETEKQQIIDAWIDGDARICQTKSIPHAQDYYTSKFETNKETLK